jgi:cytoskeleton protein RodZ
VTKKRRPNRVINNRVAPGIVEAVAKDSNVNEVATNDGIALSLPSNELVIVELEKMKESLGMQLQNARKQRGWTVAFVAEELVMSPRYIDAMEADEYSKLPEIAFIRGYMRRYAKLLKLSEDEVVATFDEAYAQAFPKPIVQESKKPHNPIQILEILSAPAIQPHKGRIIVAAIIIAIAAIIFWNRQVIADNWKSWTASHEVSTVTVETEGVPEGVVDVPAEATTSPVSGQAATPATTAPVVAPVVAKPEPKVEVKPVAVPSTAAAQAQKSTDLHTIVVVLQGSSWVSIRNFKGEALISGTMPANTYTAQGKGPFSINIGNAPVASLKLDGKLVDLKPYTQGAVANFNLRP